MLHPVLQIAVNDLDEQLDQLGNLKEFEGRHVKQTSNFLQSLDSLLVKFLLVFGLANVEQLVGVNGPNESVIVALKLTCSHIVHVNLQEGSLVGLFVSLFLVEVNIDFECLSRGEERVSEHDQC